MMGDIRAGQMYRWVGLPGQYETNSVIELGSMTGSCKVNARILTAEDGAGLITIGAADLVAAITNGWLELFEMDGEEVPDDDIVAGG